MTYGIEGRPGLHCAPLAHRTLGTFPEGALRLSPGYYTTEDEIDYTIESIRASGFEVRQKPPRRGGLIFFTAFPNFSYFPQTCPHVGHLVVYHAAPRWACSAVFA